MYVSKQDSLQGGKKCYDFPYLSCTTFVLPVYHTSNPITVKRKVINVIRCCKLVKVRRCFISLVIRPIPTFITVGDERIRNPALLFGHGGVVAEFRL